MKENGKSNPRIVTCCHCLVLNIIFFLSERGVRFLTSNDLLWIVTRARARAHTHTHTHTHIYICIFHTVRRWTYTIKRTLFRPEQGLFLLVCHFHVHVPFTYYLMKHNILQFTGAWNMFSILRVECNLNKLLCLRRRRNKQLLNLIFYFFILFFLQPHNIWPYRIVHKIPHTIFATHSLKTLLMMDYWGPKHVELLNVTNKLNHKTMCILLDYIYIKQLLIKYYASAMWDTHLTVLHWRWKHQTHVNLSCVCIN
jgi:hypothetical protein